jgi:hypothetical protein
MNLRLLSENHDNATFYIFDLATDDDAAFQMENSGNHSTVNYLSETVVMLGRHLNLYLHVGR